MNILIVAHHPVYRDTLQKILSDWFAPSSATYAADGASAIRHLEAQPFTLLLLDLEIPDIDGFSLADLAVKCSPDIRIIAFASRCDDYLVWRADRRRIIGFVDKREAIAWNFHQAIANVEANLVYYSPNFLRMRLERLKNPMSFDKILSEREISVLALIAVPYSDDEIATALRISPETVQKHRFNILKKLGQSTTAQLIRFARTRGIVHPIEHLHYEQKNPVTAKMARVAND